MKWEDLFESRILQRGYNYYKDDYVERLDETEYGYEAFVMGTAGYDVEIIVDQGEVIDMYCSCPYAEDGENCKHMAAVLYEIEETGAMRGSSAGKSEISRKEQEDAVVEAVNNTDEQVLRKFLVEILKNDDELMLRFRMMVTKEVSDHDISMYKNKLDDIISRYTGMESYIEYWAVNDFFNDIYEFINTDIGFLMEMKQYRAAFLVVVYVLGEIGEIEADDSDGGLSLIISEAAGCWECSIDRTEDITLKREMYDYIENCVVQEKYECMQEHAEDILFAQFGEPEFLKRKKHLAEKMVEKWEKEAAGYFRNYSLPAWVLRLCLVTEKLTGNKEESQRLVRKYWQFTEIRQYYVRQCIEGGHFDEAIEVLEESRELDKEFPGLVTFYRRQLKELYKTVGNKAAYQKELRQMILEKNSFDLECFREYRSLFNKEEWVNERAEIFRQIEGNYRIEGYYLEEKMYDKILDNVITSMGVSKLEQYESVLKPLYPEELLEKYRVEVGEMVQWTRDRKGYRKLVSYLRKMSSYPKGKDLVKDIVTAWRVQYRRRPAMMDELKQIKGWE